MPIAFILDLFADRARVPIEELRGASGRDAPAELLLLCPESPPYVSSATARSTGGARLPICLTCRTSEDEQAQETKPLIRPGRAEKVRGREKPLQIMPSSEELKVVETFRFQHRMPSRSAAIRDLLRRGLAAVEADDNTGVSDYSVLNSAPKGPRRPKS
jgi:hypothetical protein